jgi:hypothetical protein
MQINNTKSILRTMVYMVFVIMLVSGSSCSIGQKASSMHAKETTLKESQPSWASSKGYRANTRYIYFQKIGVYYDLKRDRFYYIEAGKWHSVRELPEKFSRHNLKRLKQEELVRGTTPKKHHRNLL